RARLFRPRPPAQRSQDCRGAGCDHVHGGEPAVDLRRPSRHGADRADRCGEDDNRACRILKDSGNETVEAFLSALLLQAGYNTALVSIGAAILGASAGAIGTFVLLRKRSLVSDAISHATLPGLALAFIVMALATGDGRWVVGLTIGAALSAGLGLLIVEWITRRTRLTEDAAIGAVLSGFFGFGVVLLTVIQT